MKKLFAIITLLALTTLMFPAKSLAAGGVYASGGGAKTVGDSFTVSVVANGATFNALEGTISVSGPVSITSFSAGGATWVTPPSNGAHFKGMVIPATGSLTVATIKLKATGIGNGSVGISSVRLANAGSDVGSGAGGASFSIQKAPDLPGAVKVSSSSHPDPNAAYDATAIALAWNKDSGVDGFSYLLDQAEKTTPSAKITDANTTVTYPDKAIGTYYFHIRAHKADGFGGTTHFKINIKEPDAKIDTTLNKPSNIKIEKTDKFANSIKDGVVTGITIKGKTEIGFTANITLTPAPTLPEGKVMTAVADESGNFELLLDFPVIAGFHKLTIQGQKEKVLTPISDEILFEISQSKGGTINILTEDDTVQPKSVKAAENVKGIKDNFLSNKNAVFYGAIALFLLILASIITIMYIRRNRIRHLKDFIKN